jgi:hypothetical protein
MLIESSTVMPCNPSLPWSFSVRPRQGRINVTHVGAIRQIVGPKLAREKLVKKRRLVAQPPRGVKSRLVRIVEAAKVASCEFEGFGLDGISALPEL